MSSCSARVLDLSTGVPVVVLVRTALDTAGTSVEICYTTVAADRFVFT